MVHIENDAFINVTDEEYNVERTVKKSLENSEDKKQNKIELRIRKQV